MQPFLPTATEVEVVSVPPPPRFRPIEGKVRRAFYGKKSGQLASGRTAAQRAGLLYERRIREALRTVFDAAYVDSPFIHFMDDNYSGRTCIPDGLLRFAGWNLTVIIEIKSQHMAESWWQLRQLYEPVLRWLHPKSKVACLEICKTLDAHAPFPEKPLLLQGLADLVDYPSKANDGAFAVCVWKT